MAAQIVEYRDQTLQDNRVRDAVGGEDAVQVYHAPAVISYLGTEQVRQFPAGLFEYDLGGAGVPEFSSRRQMDVQIAGLFRDHADFHTDGAPPDLTAKAKLRDDAGHFRASMI